MAQELPKIKIAGVPEHFNIPWHIGIANGIFKKHGVDVCASFFLFSFLFYCYFLFVLLNEIG